MPRKLFLWNLEQTPYLRESIAGVQVAETSNTYYVEP